jgi:hypothetical protein
MANEDSAQTGALSHPAGVRNVELPDDLIDQLSLVLHIGLVTRLLAGAAARSDALEPVEIGSLHLVSHIDGSHIAARNKAVDCRSISRADFRMADFVLLVMTMDQVHDYVVLIGARGCRPLNYTNDQSTVQYTLVRPNIEHFQLTLPLAT